MSRQFFVILPLF